MGIIKRFLKWCIRKSGTFLILLIGIMVSLAILSTLRPVRSAIQSLAGLAVSQTSTQWNPLKDVAAGATGLTNGISVSAPYLYNGTSWDAWKGDTTNGAQVNVTKISGSVGGNKTASDAYANPTDGIDVLSFCMGWNGATWDRCALGSNSADAEATRTLGLLESDSYLRVFNGATWDRLRGVANNADSVAATTLGLLPSVAYTYTYDGTNWDRQKSLSIPSTGTDFGTLVREVPNRRSRVAINISATGDQTLVAAVAGQTISVYKVNVVCSAATTVIYKDGVAGTAVNGAGFALAANGGWAYDGDTNPIVLTLGNAFVQNDSVANNCSGFIIYTQQ